MNRQIGNNMIGVKRSDKQKQGVGERFQIPGTKLPMRPPYLCSRSVSRRPGESCFDRPCRHYTCNVYQQLWCSVWHAYFSADTWETYPQNHSFQGASSPPDDHAPSEKKHHHGCLHCHMFEMGFFKTLAFHILPQWSNMVWYFKLHIFVEPSSPVPGCQRNDAGKAQLGRVFNGSKSIVATLLHVQNGWLLWRILGNVSWWFTVSKFMCLKQE